MKRSEINAAINQAKQFFTEAKFKLPPFAYFSLIDWQSYPIEQIREIIELQLGWDITDHGIGHFSTLGLTLFTLRNGSVSGSPYEKPYAEKIMMSQEDQVTPLHFHWHKMEDIINRGGGNLIIQLYNSDPKEGLATTPVSVVTDGILRTIQGGECICLTPGESISLPPRLYHAFWAEKGHGPVMAGEVSMVNDDACDNRYYQPLGRFPGIEEDEPPAHLLCNEYERFLKRI